MSIGSFYFYLLYSDAQKEQQTFALDFLSLIREMAIETDLVLDRLNALHDSNNRQEVTGCSAEHLLQMRQELFQTDHLKGFGHYQNDKLICTTGVGVLVTPHEPRVPDIIAQSTHAVWLNEPLPLLDESHKTIIIRSGDYHVVIDPSDIFSHGSEAFIWEWVYRDKTQVVHLYGQQNLYNQIHHKLVPNFPNVNTEVCASDITYCVAVTQQFYSLLKLGELHAGLLLVIISLILCYFMALQYFKYFYSLDRRVRRGLRRKNFFPLFQPIVNLNNQKIIGCEVLARFKDEQGYLYPDQFIPSIIEQALTVELTRVMFKAASKQLIGQTDLYENFKVSFNIFSQDANLKNFERLNKSQEFFSTRFQICFEITEDQPFYDKEATEVLNLWRDKRIEIAIDDFGTGYSNLKQLHDFNFDLLKIDKSFIDGIETDSLRVSLLTSVIDIAKQIDVPMIAEGIETEAQIKPLLALGVQFAQGYYFGRPMSAESLGELVSKQKLIKY
jgi:sensor c-di-GMP phosphodiesterase-like protein